jgi:hypothetical protein
MKTWRKRALAAGLTLVGLVAALAVAGLPLYVFPPAASVDRADLIYVIGPPTPPRIDLAEHLEAEGVASDLLVSVSPKHAGFPASSVAPCASADTVCEIPKPYTTKGEALLLSEYAPAHDVHETVVITFTPHVARTRYIFAKCFDGDVTVMGVDQPMGLGDWIYQYAYQSAAFVKAWLTPCAQESAEITP